VEEKKKKGGGGRMNINLGQVVLGKKENDVGNVISTNVTGLILS